MKFLFLSILALALAGCMTVNVSNYGEGSVCVRLEKPISTSTLPVQADGNTVPVSAIP